MTTLEELKEKLEPHWSERPAWPAPDIGAGWAQLVSDLVDDLIELWPEFKVVQVKEKFGGLRFYLENYKKDYVGQPMHESKVYSRIRQAEIESFKTCEVTGEPGKVREDIGWIRTLSDEEYEKAKARREL